MAIHLDAVAGEETAVARSRVRRLAGVTGGVLTTAIVFALLAVAASITVVPAIVGGHALTVLSGSMAPALPTGSVAVDRPVAARILRVGDVITYTGAGDTDAAITHRIIAIRPGDNGPVFTVKGDNNRVADAHRVTAAQIRGKLWYDVPYVGLVRNVVSDRSAPLIIGALLLFGAGFWLLRKTFGGSGGDSGSAS